MFLYNFGNEDRFEQKLLSDLEDYKKFIRTPIVGSSQELKQLKKNIYENKIAEQNLRDGAKFLSELYGINNIDYLMGLIKQKGSVENVVLAEKKGELDELNKLIKNKKWDNDSYYRRNYDNLRRFYTPRTYNNNMPAVYAQPQVYVPPQYVYRPKEYEEAHSKIISLLEKAISELNRPQKPTNNSELFLRQLIKDTYKPNTKIYQNKDDISVLLNNYMKMMKTYKLKSKEIKDSLDKLTQTLSYSMGIPQRELKPFVNMAVPMIEEEPRFFR